MPSLQAALPNEHQEFKSPTGARIETEPPLIMSHPEKNPRDGRLYSLAGQKRQRSPSPQANPRERYVFPAATPHNLESLEGPQPKENRHCCSCGFPCWRCKTPPDVPKLQENQSPEHESIEPPSAPPSALASSSTSELASTSGSDCTATSDKKRKTWAARGLTFVGPKDEDFMTKILFPCGLVLDGRQPSNLMPSTIFGSQTSSLSSRVLLSKTDGELREIMQDFHVHENREYNEHALLYICADSIILRDRNMPNGPFDEAEYFKAERRDKWKPHKEGPKPGVASTYVYDWDLKPDVTYTVSLRMFNAKDRRDLRFGICQPWLAEADSACPYLTIELKVSHKIGQKSHAESQTAAASMLWLHQRKAIRDALSKSLDDLRHYVITIFDTSYRISETYFKGEGYRIRTLTEGKLTMIDDLKRYIEWSNAIHTWGLGPNATSFKAEIQQLLERKRAQNCFIPPKATRPAANVCVPTLPAS